MERLLLVPFDGTRAELSLGEVARELADLLLLFSQREIAIHA